MTMVAFLIIILVLVCILLMAVVLMQASKGGGLAGPLGGANVTTMFGARRTSDFLSKSTIVLAVIFMLTSLLLNIYIGKSGNTTSKGVLQQNSSGQEAPVQQPVNTPGTEQTPQDNNQQPNNQTP